MLHTAQVGMCEMLLKLVKDYSSGEEQKVEAINLNMLHM